MNSANKLPPPSHVAGVPKGEEFATKRGPEPGRSREKDRPHRTARDSTGINADRREPIHPKMAHLPPS